MAQLKLKNFRKFESLESLDLGDINIFVGKNNAGKSTVVKAILLVLDNLRSLRWTNVSLEEGLQSIQFAPKPLFRFDANGFHNLHIGTFERAKCNWLDDPRITISLNYEGFEFEIVVAGVAGGGQVSVPIESLKISLPQHSSYFFDFQKSTMSFRMDKKQPDDDAKRDKEKELLNIDKIIAETETIIKDAMKVGDAIKIADSQDLLRKQRAHRNLVTRRNVVSDISEVTFDLSYYQEGVGDNILVQYLRSFIKLSRTSIVGVGNVLTSAPKLRTNSTQYKEEESKRLFISENHTIIEEAANRLEKLLNSINIDYIQAHAATQKLIIHADEKNDINSRIINDYYQENIPSAGIADSFLKSWLKKFEIGNSITIESLDGEGYYVKISTDDDVVHLADMGMGSIQLVILLLRLATIGNRSLRTGESWWVVIEEPEQNLHPKIQSMLADLFQDFIKTFNKNQHTLIAETHSECLVRRTQVIVKDKSYIDYRDIFRDNPFSTIYFPSKRGEQPYKMIYQTDGKFENDFGEGFFDEAENLAFEIL